MSKNRNVWSKEEEQYLIDNYRDQTAKETAQILSRSTGAVSQKIGKLIAKGALKSKLPQCNPNKESVTFVEAKRQVKAKVYTLEKQKFIIWKEQVILLDL